MSLAALRLLLPQPSTSAVFRKHLFSSATGTAFSTTRIPSSVVSASSILPRSLVQTTTNGPSSTQRTTAMTIQTTAATAQSDNDNDRSNHSVPDMEDFHVLHDEALQRAETTYIDPSTGFTVFTELTHLKRGKCCGNRCRHCPYGFEKVGRVGSWRKRRANSKIDPSLDPPASTIVAGAPVAKLRSGDSDTAQRMVREILERAGKWNEEKVPRRRRQSTKIDNIHEDDVSSTSSSSSSSSSSASSCCTPSEEQNSTLDAPTTITVPIDSKMVALSSTRSTSATASITSKSSTGSARTDNHANPENNNSNNNTRRSTRPNAGVRSTKNVPYTRGGDQGTSQLGTGERRSKTDDAFEAMGSVDELCTFVGVAHSQLADSPKNHGDLPLRLLDVMSRLFDVGSHVAKPQSGVFVANGIGDGFDDHHVDQLEDWIHDMTEDLPELTSFILPTGAPASASLHVCRTVCRRAERRLIPLIQEGVCDPNALRYLNRLSDFFFVSARWVNLKEGREEIEYRMAYEEDEQEEQRERVHRSLAETKDE